jgi:cytochrome P450
METSRKTAAVGGRSNSNKAKASILDHILSQHDINGAGLSNAVATELSILLYMVMDAGNAWTAMALNLLSLDHHALAQVQDEIDHLVGLHGKDKLFTPRVLGRMRTVDALIWEAIRLCPPFCGGMKVTTETVVLEADGIQIPKNANVIFCQPTDRPFDLAEAMGKKPQDLTLLYPCINM